MAENNPLKPDGQNGSKDIGKVFCANCGHAFVPVACKKIEDFHVVGEYWGCPVCHSPLEPPKDNTSQSASCSAKPDALGVLFGDNVPRHASSTSIYTIDASDVHLCKDCRYYLIHPFESRCTRFDRKVEPTDDCPDFEEKKRKRNLDI